MNKNLTLGHPQTPHRRCQWLPPCSPQGAHRYVKRKYVPRRNSGGPWATTWVTTGIARGREKAFTLRSPDLHQTEITAEVGD